MKSRRFLLSSIIALALATVIVAMLRASGGYDEAAKTAKAVPSTPAHPAAAVPKPEPPVRGPLAAMTASEAPKILSPGRIIEHWPGWLCIDRPDGDSDWYRADRDLSDDPNDLNRFAGTCDMWSGPPPIDAKDFAQVPELPPETCDDANDGGASAASGDCPPSSSGESNAPTRPIDWWCSDVTEGGVEKSLWFRSVDGPPSAFVYDGLCASWAAGERDEPWH